MSQDNKRVEELQTALRTKMADNKAIADSFKIEEGTVVVSAEQKSAFDKNMVDIKEIKSLISGLSAMEEVDQWASQPQGSVAGAYASAAAGVQQLTSREIKTIGEMFLDSPEFKHNTMTHKPEFCTMKNCAEFCKLERLSKTNQVYYKNPKLSELYSILFPDMLPPNDLHNSLVDVAITLRCYIKYVYNFDIKITNESIKQLFLSI